MSGSIGILNVGAGDTKLTFDKTNPAECIRAARIVKDMLRRGYALLIEVENNGKKSFQRVLDFREDVYEYIIADLDPEQAAKADAEEVREQSIRATHAAQPTKTGREEAPVKLRGRKAVAADKTRGVAIARTAGG